VVKCRANLWLGRLAPAMSSDLEATGRGMCSEWATALSINFYERTIGIHGQSRYRLYLRNCLHGKRKTIFDSMGYR
jgi:hypothetical protein